ncbi:MAG: ATPase [Chloroflexi bacterium OLB14]|nr:MAG: ATPase [Chloroflexi bacterium OLB14]
MKNKSTYVTHQFTWIPIYQELAKELVNWQTRQDELIAFLESLRKDGHVITSLTDKDKNGSRFLLKEIDPFTFFGVFNRGIGFEQRVNILAKVKQFFKLKSDLPDDFNGIPILNNIKSWFVTYQNARKKNDVTKLWKVFALSFSKNPLRNKSFLKAFDEALKVKETNLNLTMGLFWINPHTFLNLDSTNCRHLKIKIPAKGINAKFYVQIIEQVSSLKKSFPEISLEAWGYENERSRMIAETKRAYKTQKAKTPYGIKNLISDGIFLSELEINEIIERLKTKKALILQGAAGVGKTFLAKKLAYALMQEIDSDRLEMVQFHQSYSYDDFVRGYRPDGNGSFALKNGVFYEFCQKAINNPDQEFIFIIDEINRGNLSQIFGELLMLIESDKRGVDYSVPLLYHAKNKAKFYIPSNLYIIGLMNLADRSLAMVDYALRRRFAFVTLQPKYESEIFKHWLLERKMKPELVNLIIKKLSTLNQKIKDDSLLGENYQIGHSFFCPKGDDFSYLNENWYQSIIKTEIVPLLKEYWFDNPKKAEEVEKELLS